MKQKTDPAHPLDRPVWGALTTRQAHLALGDARAVRLAPDYGPFAAAADMSPASLDALAALVPSVGSIATVETAEMPALPGTTATQAACDQMVMAALVPGDIAFPVMRLRPADAAEMLALATLTKPGPFFARTHVLGAFVGVKVGGRLVAMAGERMRLPGFTEVSGVCTHPDHRGQGFAAGLMRTVVARILSRYETPFLHVYSNNRGAIALYETLGFKLRRVVTLTTLSRG